MEQKVVRVINPSVRQVSWADKKTGKQQNATIVRVALEDGTEAEGFGPVEVGQMAYNIEYNERYDVVQAKFRRPDKSEAVLDAQRKIYTKLEAIHIDIKRLLGEEEVLDKEAVKTQRPTSLRSQWDERNTNKPSKNLDNTVESGVDDYGGYEPEQVPIEAYDDAPDESMGAES